MHGPTENDEVFSRGEAEVPRLERVKIYD